ncbi:hypothetical protein ACLFMI_02400 [Pseudonocardia nantongensis]|uniref:hypothetical protein n=1 Tax=Pseudonocardia nantongensis TaxID=1181885 RepID=UPI00397DB36A
MSAPRIPARRPSIRRIAAVGALAVPMTVAGAGFAFAGDYGDGGGHDKGKGDCGNSVAHQKGGLLGADAAVDPALNLGGIGNDGPVSQQSTKLDKSNSGVTQSGCGDLEAVQVDDLVGLGLDVSPSANVGGILNSGPVEQSTTDVDRSNSGVTQDGSGHGSDGDAIASQKGGLLDVDAEVSPQINIGGLLSSGPVSQDTTSVDQSNSGVVQG